MIRIEYSLASVGILEKKKREGKLGWHGNFDKRFERNKLICICEIFQNLLKWRRFTSLVIV